MYFVKNCDQTFVFPHYGKLVPVQILRELAGSLKCTILELR